MSFFSAIADLLASLARRPAPGPVAPPAPVPVGPVTIPAPAGYLPASQRRASAKLKGFIKGKETCRLKAYPDPKTGGAPWTCGWGSTSGVTADTAWTQEQADHNFEADIANAESLVRRYVTHDLTQGQFDAFVSIFQNVGPGSATRDGIGRLKNGSPSTLLRCFNAGDLAGCMEQWVRWISPGSNVEHGLLLRRQAELKFFRGEV